jgi:DNA polymerase elongation subunit (family B)
LRQVPASTRRLLDFDVETVAAGYADPQWVPSTVTAWAFSWGQDIQVEALPVADFYDVEARRAFLRPLLDALAQADVVTGHNVCRFDLPILQAECMRLGLPSLSTVLVQDTIRLPRAKGFKKGQDNLGVLLDVPLGKLPLNFQQWAEAYAEPNLHTVKERVAGDVRQHMLIREQMRVRGWLRPPRMWSP